MGTTDFHSVIEIPELPEENTPCCEKFNLDESDCLREKDNEKIKQCLYQRSVSKAGKCNLRKKRRPNKYTYFVTDMFTSLVDLRWRYILIIYSFSFLVTWYFFAVLWWVVAYAHGDLASSPHRDHQVEPCVTNIDDMASAFLFSLETQYTTGYGTRSPTAQCPEAIFLLCVQSIFGVLLQSILVGVVFTKYSRCKARSQAIRFSQKSVICLRDGHLCFMFRLADVWRSHLVHCKIFAWALQTKVTAEGEILPNYKTKLNLSVDGGGGNFCLLWPVTVIHKIDHESPFYNLSANDLSTSEFEVLVSLICTAQTTGQMTETRCSYMPNEILWGSRFQNILQKDQNGLHVDYGKFDKTTKVDTAICSACQLYSWSQSNSPISTNKTFQFPPN